MRMIRIQQEDEAERLRLRKLAEEEAELLLRRLRNIEEEEAERIKKMRLVQLEHQVETEKLKKLRHAEMETERYKLMQIQSQHDGTILPAEHFGNETAAYGDFDLLGISEEELDQQCDELFNEAPIEFKPRKDNEIDLMIVRYIREHSITIPIIWIKKDLYLIGSNRLSVDLKRDTLMLRVGGGYEKFEEYVPKNLRYFQRILVIHMIKSGESLEWVVDALINGRKIRNINQQIQQEANYLSKFRYPGMLESSLYSTGRKSLLTPPRMSYTQRQVRQTYRSPIMPRRSDLLVGNQAKRTSMYSPLNETYTSARRRSTLMNTGGTADITPESLNYKMQKQEILKGLKDTYSTTKFTSKVVTKVEDVNKGQ